MGKIRTLVVDDEPMARERVVTLLRQEDDMHPLPADQILKAVDIGHA